MNKCLFMRVPAQRLHAGDLVCDDADGSDRQVMYRVASVTEHWRTVSELDHVRGERYKETRNVIEVTFHDHPTEVWRPSRLVTVLIPDTKAGLAPGEVRNRSRLGVAS